jgi:hypothetical protein
VVYFKTKAKKVADMMLQEVAFMWFTLKKRPKSGGHDVARSSGQVVQMKEKAKKVAVMML